MTFEDLLSILRDKEMLDVREGKTTLKSANTLYFKSKELYFDAKVIRLTPNRSKGIVEILINRGLES